MDSIKEQNRPPSEQMRIERFISALSQAMVVNDCSQRRLATIIGVESGTFTKYFQGKVDPLKVGTGIQSALAAALGVTIDSLVAFYNFGTYLSGVSLDEVMTWISREARQQHVAKLLSALQVTVERCQEAGERWELMDITFPTTLSPFNWPLEQIEQLKLAPDLLVRMGVTPEALQRLVEEGEITENLVSGFALATGFDEDSVRLAFQERQPVRAEACKSSW